MISSSILARLPYFALLLTGLAASAEPGVQHLSYDEAVAIALRDNVDLLALREQEASFQHKSIQALSPENPVLSLYKVDIPSFSLSEEAATTTYSVNWTLGFPGKALSQSASIRHQAASAAEQARAEEITILTSLSNSYAAFAANEAFFKFLLDEQKRQASLMKLLEKKFAVSQSSKVDLLNAEVTAQQLALSILENRNEYEVALTQFRQLLRRPLDKTLEPLIPATIQVAPLKETFDELVPVMLRNNHAVGSASEQRESSAALLTNARLQALPDFQLSAGVSNWLPQAAPLAPITHDYNLGIGIAIPIFFPLNELQGIESAKHELAAAESQVTSQQLQAIAALQTAYTSLNALLKDVDASERLVVPAAKASFDLTLLTYGLGKADYFMLNQSRLAWHEAERDLITKRQNAAQLYSQLIAQLGCDLTRKERPYACR